jgi:hypothetical protein
MIFVQQYSNIRMRSIDTAGQAVYHLRLPQLLTLRDLLQSCVLILTVEVVQSALGLLQVDGVDGMVGFG